MKKWFHALLLAAGLVLAFIPAALAGAITADELHQVFPEAPAGDATLSRGAFAALLARAAGYEVPVDAAGTEREAWYTPAVMALKAEGVIRGYPDGNLHADRPVTLLEAAVMTSRALGLPDGVAAPEVEGSLERENWGYTPYAWLVRVGLLQPGEDTGALLSVEEGVTFLARVFSSDPEAERIVTAAQKAQTEVKDVSFTGNMAITVSPRPEVAGKMPVISMQGSIMSELSYPLSLHQKMDISLDLPPMESPPEGLPADGRMEIAMEQYLVDRTIYQKVYVPGMAEAQWMKLPQAFLPDLEDLIQQSRKTPGLPPEMQDKFYFRYRGEGMVKEHKVHHVAYYGRIDDWQALMQALPGGLAPEMEQVLDQAGGFLKSVSYWGEEAIGVEDNLTYASAMTGMVAFTDQFLGESMPLENLTFTITAADYQYNTGVKIELPDEALAAPEIPLTPPQSDVDQGAEQQVQQ